MTENKKLNVPPPNFKMGVVDLDHPTYLMREVYEDEKMVHKEINPAGSSTDMDKVEECVKKSQAKGKEEGELRYHDLEYRRFGNDSLYSTFTALHKVYHFPEGIDFPVEDKDAPMIVREYREWYFTQKAGRKLGVEL